MNRDDVLFLDIYRSIRGDWSSGIDQRAGFMLKLLPLTTLSNNIKEELKQHLEKMITAWNSKQEASGEKLWIRPNGETTDHCSKDVTVNPKFVDFDGRSWARDCHNNYNDLMKLPWFDMEYYIEWSLNNLGSVCL